MHIQLPGIVTRSPRTFSIAAATLVAALTFATASATPAHAALLSSGACDDSALTQPFSAWGDTNAYKLIPGGDFEGSTAGWTLNGGAGVVSGGVGGQHALSLPAGASAQTPFTCVNASYPSIRLFARNDGLLSTVAVTLVYRNLLGLLPLPALPGVAALDTSWAPSLPLLTLAPVGGLLSGGTAQVAIRFTSLTGSTQIDNVYVDPRMRH